MKQQSLEVRGFKKYRKKTRKESIFWYEMEQLCGQTEYSTFKNMTLFCSES